MTAVKPATLSKFWHRPEMLLFVMIAAMSVSFGVWQALLNNFAIERAAFSGVEIGILQSLREIPGFLAFGAVLLLGLTIWAFSGGEKESNGKGSNPDEKVIAEKRTTKDSPDNSPDPPLAIPPAGDWITLFNGEDFSGWEMVVCEEYQGHV